MIDTNTYSASHKDLLATQTEELLSSDITTNITMTQNLISVLYICTFADVAVLFLQLNHFVFCGVTTHPLTEAMHLLQVISTPSERNSMVYFRIVQGPDSVICNVWLHIIRLCFKDLVSNFGECLCFFTFQINLLNAFCVFVM